MRLFKTFSLFSLLLIFLYSSCCKEDQGSSISEIPFNELRIKRITKEYTNFSSVEEFVYNDLGQVIKNSKTPESSSFFTNILLYKYDLGGKLIQKHLLRKKQEQINYDTIQITDYSHNENENLVLAETYKEDGTLAYEEFYEYDNKINFANGLSDFLIAPYELQQNANNITRYEIIDHSAELQLATNPFIVNSTYEYYQNGLPNERSLDFSDLHIYHFEYEAK